MYPAITHQPWFTAAGYQRGILRSSVKERRASSSPIRRYGIALLCVAIAFVATLLLQHLFPYPFLFLFFGAVMASAWFGGTGAGLFAVLLSTAIVGYCFVPPFYSFSISTTAEAYFAAFVACAIVASWVSSLQKKSEEALKDARDRLELRVSERTAELMKTQAELSYLSRVLSMGELAASIAHEIGQPLTAVVTHGHACLEWLAADPPNVAKARHSAEKIVQDGTRGGHVLARVRALFSRQAPVKEWIDVNEALEELMLFVRDEAARRNVAIRAELSAGLPKTKADRVQLQQVVLNLLMNGMDAMAEVSNHAKELVISSRLERQGEILVSVADCGAGLNPENAERIFDPFFTTKPRGTGMGLAISRSIVESHEGKIWATPRPGGGTVLHFTIPIVPEEADG